MARVRFLAPTSDPRPGQEGIVYGPLHETDFQDEDIDFLVGEIAKGKAEVLDTSGLGPETLARLGVPQKA